MRNRIVGVAVLAAVLATTLFGLPLAYGVSQYFLGDESNELERGAAAAAPSATFDLAAGQSPTGMTSSQDDIILGFYDLTGARTSGGGPPDADSTASDALRDGRVSSADDVGGQQVVAVPVTDGQGVVGVVRAASDYAGVRLRIAGACGLMLGLAAVAIALTWLIARRQ